MLNRSRPGKGLPLPLATIALLLAGCEEPRSETPGPADPPPILEHHAHIGSTEANGLLLEIAAAVGQEVDADGEATTAEDLLAAMDSAGVQRAQVLSTAYFYGFPDFPIEDGAEEARRENDWVAQEVARFPTRLVGACSVNPLADWAVAEVERCAGDDRLSGLKLHFANSDVDLRDPAQLTQLRAVFQAARDGELPIVAHIRTRNIDYGTPDVDLFIDSVLVPLPGLRVQLAHMAGWGGYDQPTDDALTTFIRAFDEGRLDRSDYTFDLAAVVVPLSMAQGDTTRIQYVEKWNGTLAERVRELGPDRVLFASDWSALPLAGYLDVVRTELPLTESELEDVLDNVGPLFKTRNR